MNKRPTLPKGAGLFGEHQPEHKPTPAWQAHIDGGSRGNPGPAAYGVVLRDARGEIVARLKKYIGQNTNNVAEYYGLIAALDYAQSHGIRALRIASDSELLVKQMSGRYKVKSADLRPLFERARKMAQGLEFFRIDHVYREQNREADALANQALDETSKSAGGAASNKESAPPQHTTIRCLARYKDGVLQPQEPLDLPDGAHVEVMLRLRK
jgi:ribonuclease HI